MERSYANFEQTYTLPDNVDKEHISKKDANQRPFLCSTFMVLKPVLLLPVHEF